jgi:raffinose/stachyose/melibiose transport system substrate-binding protein
VIFNQLGLSVPVTWDDLEADLLSIKDAGLIPITFGNADRSAGVDTFGALAHAYSDIQDINNLISRTPGAAFLTEGNLEATQNFIDWIDKGYFSPNFATIDNNVALAEFTSGKSALWLASTDNSAAISAAMGSDQVGLFPLPSPIGDSITPTVGGLGLAYGIRATSPNADLAAQYIDLTTNPAVANALLSICVLPAISVDPSTVQMNTLIADLANAWSTISAADKVGQRLDLVLPSIATQIEALTAHRLDPEAFVNAVQKDYEAGT